MIARVLVSIGGIAVLTACDAAGVHQPRGEDGGSDTTVALVTISPAAVTLETGDTTRLTETVENSTGVSLTGKQVAWASDAPSVATVSAAGLVTAVMQGSARVTASVEGRTGSAVVTVARTDTRGRECDTPDPTWIWCDDFENDRLARYFEYGDAGGDFVRLSGEGRDGSWAMRARWATGQVSAGVLHLAMGRTPDSYIAPVDAGVADYREIFWRLYLRNEAGWSGGGGAKLTRAFIFAGPDFSQAMVAHVWAASPPREAYLAIDPVSGTDADGTVRTTRYNDFDNFQWLGIRYGTTPLFGPSGVGTWHCIEAHVRLNDAGEQNGVFELWVDGNLDASRYDLDWVGPYVAYGINAVYLENYWDAGSPREQARYFDDFVVSTSRIGC